jgi:hypothetical protein
MVREAICSEISHPAAFESFIDEYNLSREALAEEDDKERPNLQRALAELKAERDDLWERRSTFGDEFVDQRAIELTTKIDSTQARLKILDTAPKGNLKFDRNAMKGLASDVEAAFAPGFDAKSATGAKVVAALHDLVGKIIVDLSHAVYRSERLSGGLNESETIASEGWDPRRTKFVLDHLDPEHALGDALISLLRAGAKDELYVFQDKAGRTDSSYRDSSLKGYVRVAFFLPLPIARIEHQIAHVRKVWRYGFLGGTSLDSYISVLRERHMGGRKQMIEIDGPTFEIIGSAIAD